MSEQRVAKKASRTGGWITRSLLLILLLCLAALGPLATTMVFHLPINWSMSAIRLSVVAELEASQKSALDTIPGQVDAAITERLAAVVQDRTKIVTANRGG